MSNKSYKNNHIKQGVWSTIATSIGMGRSECQVLWKSLRRRYKSAKSKYSRRSGSERSELKGFLKILVTEMDYFEKFWDDDVPNVTNYVDSSTNSFRELFDQMAEDPEVIDTLAELVEYPTDSSQSICSPPSTSKEAQKRKRSWLADAEATYEQSLKTLNELASTVVQSASVKVDPFFLSLQEEFLKVPDDQRSALKLMTLVIEHQGT